MKCETNRLSDISSGSPSGDRSLDLKSKVERIRSTVETCEEALVFTLEGSLPSTATEDILEEGVQLFENRGSGRTRRSRWSGRPGGQHNRVELTGSFGTVGGGGNNAAGAYGATVAGGGGFDINGKSIGNRAEGAWGTISGGAGNTSTADSTTIAGGKWNTVSALGGTIGGATVTFDGLPTGGSVDTSGVLGGVVGGYSWQSGPFVIGVEGDLLASDINGNGALALRQNDDRIQVHLVYIVAQIIREPR